MNKKISKIIFIIGAIIFLFGTVLYFILLNIPNKNLTNKDNSDNNKISNELVQEHCLENICIRSMKIKSESNYSTITGTIENKSNALIQSDNVNITFYLKDKSMLTQSYTYQNLEPGIKTKFEFVIPVTVIKNAVDYNLTK